MTTLIELQNAFNNTELKNHCEDFTNAMDYYEGEKNADDFMEWYKETYIDCAEIVYYHNAMKFLLAHDPSLQESMSLAHEYGYTCDKVNSELLASLLLQGVLNEALESLRNDLTNYFEGVNV